LKLAFVVSHPIQYYVPLYRRLAARGDLEVKVFFTWHAGSEPVYDPGFGRAVAWDIPLTQGYDHTLVRNIARSPGTDHFNGIVNPTLTREVLSWQPDAVHVTGWAWRSHLQFLREAHARVPLLFRGDSHLLDGLGNPLRWCAKRAVLRRIYAWPRIFLYTGAANRAYYAGKLERRKRPLEFMRAVLERTGHFVVMVGEGELEGSVRELAARHPQRCRVLPFQNQQAMPRVYRLGDVFVLPSSHGETWGLAVNEALACGRPVVVSERVGCAQDAVRPPSGRVFARDDLSAMIEHVNALLRHPDPGELRRHAAQLAGEFDVPRTEDALLAAVRDVVPGR